VQLQLQLQSGTESAAADSSSISSLGAAAAPVQLGPWGSHKRFNSSITIIIIKAKSAVLQGIKVHHSWQ
jgi:hypothetical protein